MELTSIENCPAVRQRKCSSSEHVHASKLDISIPGLSRIFDRSSPKSTKIIWLLTLTICGTVCTCFTVNQVQEYFKYETTSKILIARKEYVQFPSISICSISSDECYAKELEKEIVQKCQEYNITNFPVNEISIHQLGINLTNVWDRCYFTSVNVYIMPQFTDVDNTLDDLDYKVTNSHSQIGTCATITHTKHVVYVSAATRLELIIVTNKNNFNSEDLIFCPHEESELIINEMENVLIGYRTQFKLREEMFELKNITGKECYDFVSEYTRIEQSYVDAVSSKACRLPFFPDYFPECDTLSDLQASTREFLSSTAAKLREKFESIRVCRQVTYGITTDFVLPTDLTETNIDENTTEIIVKFADDTRQVVTEYMSYTFPALTSDICAYWGFFLCFSALAFAEIAELLFQKIFQYCTNRNRSKNYNGNPV